VYRSFQDVTEFQQEIERLQSLPSLLESREQMSLLPGDAASKKPGAPK
jgi:transcriptional repressor NrdR